MASQALVRVSVTLSSPTPVWTRLTMVRWNRETEIGTGGEPRTSWSSKSTLTSSYGEIFNFIVQVVTVHIENNADVEDEEGDEQVGYV